MTTPEEGRELTRVGPGTPMGALMRRHWIPAAFSSELEADGDPMRLVLLGGRLDWMARDARGLGPLRRRIALLAREEAVDLTALDSSAGALEPGDSMISRPPYAAPHHDASKAALVGGGSGHVRPGEISRAWPWSMGFPGRG